MAPSASTGRGTNQEGFNLRTEQGSPVRFMLLAHFIYLVAFYLLLTQDNPFNFSNNYHMIGLLTILYLLVSCSLFMFFVQNQRLEKAGLNTRLARKAAGDQDHSRDAQAFSNTSFFISSLLQSALIALPMVYYLLLLDDFMLRARQLAPLLIFCGLFFYAYWGAWRELLARPGWLPRLLYFIFFCGLLLLLLNLLTGIIPVSLRPAGDSVIFPL